MNEHSFFILLPDTLAQQSQQCCHKAKSGKLFSYMSNKLVNRIQLWFDSLRQTNSHCSTEDKFECSGLAISQSRYCSYSGSAWHLVDDISRCSSSRGSVSKDEEAPVETCSCPDLSRSLLDKFQASKTLHFFSGSVEAHTGLLRLGFYMPMFPSFMEFRYMLNPEAC